MKEMSRNKFDWYIKSRLIDPIIKLRAVYNIYLSEFGKFQGYYFVFRALPCLVTQIQRISKISEQSLA